MAEGITAGHRLYPGLYAGEMSGPTTDDARIRGGADDGIHMQESARSDLILHTNFKIC
ncbi:hypothetical protein L1S32_08695 [Methanogenium sp. S4BF]|uniref:hypothetical protein n=1 Tax=Methanogenium sp. S4BF TaxID=1789226 RepID=UPI00241783B7|nr:hypothetical protein [Methanogenium sp. S4BF]WFN33919.1 hypothetical protein L1S32_08695 [Methanogenium sp. S4BF]